MPPFLTSQNLVQRDKALTAAGGPYYWVTNGDTFTRLGWQGIKNSTAGAGTFAFFVTMKDTRPLDAERVRPADGTATGSLPLYWVVDPSLVFASNPAAAATWNPLPLQASGFAWTFVLVQLTVSADIAAGQLDLFFAGGT